MNRYAKIFFLTLSLAAHAADIEMEVMGVVDPDQQRRDRLAALVAVYYQVNTDVITQPDVIFTPSIDGLGGVTGAHVHIQLHRGTPARSTVHITNWFYNRSLPYLTRLSPVQAFELRCALARSQSTHEKTYARFSMAATCAQGVLVATSAAIVVTGIIGVATKGPDSDDMQEPLPTIVQASAGLEIASLCVWPGCGYSANRVMRDGEVLCVEKACREYDTPTLIRILNRYHRLYPDKPAPHYTTRAFTYLMGSVDHPELIKQIIAKKIEDRAAV